jgi:hypothetical protein
MSDPTPSGTPKRDDPHRPLVERIGMAAVALVLGVLFVVVAVAAFVGGEPFLGVMSAIGALMVAWAGGRTLFEG